MSRVGFEPTTLCLEARLEMIRRTRKINDCSLFSKGSAHFGSLSSSTNFDHFRCPTGTTTGTRSWRSRVERQ